jgi:hypothetical protein
MSSDTAVQNFPNNFNLDEFDTDELPTMGNPAQICPQLQARYELKLLVAQLEQQTRDRIVEEIESCYDAHPDYDTTDYHFGPVILAEMKQCWDEHDKISTTVDFFQVISPPVAAPAPKIDSTPTAKTDSVPTFRSARQTRKKKSISPAVKRFLTDEESRLLSRGVLPGTVHNWNTVRLRGRQRFCYRMIVARERRGRQKRAAFVLA